MTEPVGFFHFEGVACLLGLLRDGKIGVNSFALGASLCVEVDRRTMTTTVDVPTLAKCAGISPRSGFRARDELLSVGFISVANRPGRSSVTTMNPCQPDNAPLPDWQRTLATEATHPCQIGSLYRRTDIQKKHTPGVADESAPPADRENPDSAPAPGTVFDTGTPPQPAKAKSRGKAAPTEADAQRVLDRYRATIKGGRGNAPDGSGSRKVFLATISKRLERHTVEDLIQSIDNFATTERVRDPSCRKGCQTFFGDKFELFRDFLPGTFEPPPPSAEDVEAERLVREAIERENRLFGGNGNDDR